MSRNNPDELKVRFQGDLKQRLAEAAEKNSRSLNSEVIMRLEDSFKHFGEVPSAIAGSPDLAKLIVEMHGILTSISGVRSQSALSLLPPLAPSPDAKATLNFFKPRKPKRPSAK